MTREEKILDEMRHLLVREMCAEVTQLKRKLKELEKQRDEWKCKARTLKEYTTKYQKELSALRRGQTSAPGTARPSNGSPERQLTKTQRSRMTSGFFSGASAN